ncbi:MAG TPA: DUF1579 family protein [Ohtaekwangia sp.]|nr:DUF1579 family protein [Ohtaekwangia sp.]
MIKNNSTALQQLDKFVGQWNTTGKILPTATTLEIKISGTDTYEWLPGKYFLLHKANVLMGDEKIETFEIIGFDIEKNIYTMQHYDSQGNSGFMSATHIGNNWTLQGDSLKFTGGFKSDHKEFSGRWEQLNPNGSWADFMDINLNRVNP